MRRRISTEMWNPTTGLFFPQFIGPEAGSSVLHFMVPGMTSMALDTLMDLAVAVGLEESEPGAKFWRRQKLASGGPCSL